MDKALRDLLDSVDETLARMVPSGVHYELVILGRSALILHYGFAGVTKDLDIVHGCLPGELEQVLLERFGADSGAEPYLEAVSSGLPPLPNNWRQRCSPLPGDWVVLRPLVLNPNHLAVSKLSRFHPRDRRDIQDMADRGLLDSGELQDALDRALYFTDEDQPPYDNMRPNLQRVLAYLGGEVDSL